MSSDWMHIGRGPRTDAAAALSATDHRPQPPRSRLAVSLRGRAAGVPSRSRAADAHRALLAGARGPAPPPSARPPPRAAAAALRAPTQGRRSLTDADSGPPDAGRSPPEGLIFSCGCATRVAAERGGTAARRHGGTARLHGGTAARPHGGTAARRRRHRTSGRLHGTVARRDSETAARRLHGCTACGPLRDGRAALHRDVTHAARPARRLRLHGEMAAR